jgi:hypothetical protein
MTILQAFELGFVLGAITVGLAVAYAIRNVTCADLKGRK